MVAYTKPQQRKKEESERLRGEGNQIKLIKLSDKVMIGRNADLKLKGTPLLAKIGKSP